MLLQKSRDYQMDNRQNNDAQFVDDLKVYHEIPKEDAYDFESGE